MKRNFLLFTVFIVFTVFVWSSCEKQKTYYVEPFNTTGKEFKSLPSGLQYIVVKEGTGKQMALGKKFTLHYSLYLATSIPSYYNAIQSTFLGDPFVGTLTSGSLVKGFEEGLTLMKEGSKYRLLVPHKLGYGANAAGSIPPYSDLLFDVELLLVE
jgi:FKBP-type peptidyl-prolyl cis-trans isomerase FklB